MKNLAISLTLMLSILTVYSQHYHISKTEYYDAEGNIESIIEREPGGLTIIEYEDGSFKLKLEGSSNITYTKGSVVEKENHKVYYVSSPASERYKFTIAEEYIYIEPLNGGHAVKHYR